MDSHARSASSCCPPQCDDHHVRIVVDAGLPVARRMCKALALLNLAPVSARPSVSRTSVEGSGTGTRLATGTPPCGLERKVAGVVVPSKFTLTVNVSPFGSLVSKGVLPVLSNIAKPKVLSEVDVPSGAVRAGPSKESRKVMAGPNVNPSK